MGPEIKIFAKDREDDAIMPFVVRQDCPCCRKGTEKIKRITEDLHKECEEKGLNPVTAAFDKVSEFKNIYSHCEPCWNRYHGGKRDKDFDSKLAPPYYHAQSE